MKHLFLDTNVFLYYKDFEQIDWMSLLNFKGAFTIDIPEQVIKEIDKLKDQGKDKVKDSSFGSKNYQQPAILRFFRRSLQTGSSYQPCR